ncbi:hypothetical protein AYJ54_37690 [Bradyrhizobium centrolobii]|uniref:Uncharacterized protein n=1 Tax=Bradyrhizobium centrolobii TaxID=1505087 RepID=A0A176Z9T9_9BRAD|nr:hypothetical protein [Bradyrhizobium centrolobii]OAF16623.1 hypothetical protein AYJ54_37690 [Bradyrhizobium centrolobii]
MTSIRTQARSEMRLNVIRLLAFGLLLVLPAASRAQHSPSIAEQIAKTYGLDSFGQIEAIRYTWNGEFPGGHKISNKWEWSPKTDTVAYEGKDKEGNPVKVTYQRSQLSSQSDVVKKEVDPAFVNDQYWVLLPFHLLWDGATATDDGQQKRPTGDASAQKVVVKYPSEGGYQPGDTWDLYIGADKRIEEIAYHRGAANPPHFVTGIYADHKKAGPLLISTDHPGMVDGKPFRITLTDVSVKLTGSDKWIDAQ